MKNIMLQKAQDTIQKGLSKPKTYHLLINAINHVKRNSVNPISKHLKINNNDL
jgi:hypothetical protein